MRLALDEARLALDHGDVPVGAVAVRAGELIGRGHNRREIDGDPTAHAEMLAIREACRLMASERLPQADLYVTLEPCPMCAAAISFSRIRRLYFGAADEKGGAVVSGVRLFSQPTCHHAPETYAGFAEKRASQMLKSFFRDKR